jgi:NADPH2:quinone reductase
MRAIVLRRFGSKEVLEEREMVKPEPFPDEVQIKVAYAGVNPVDWKVREGYLVQRMQHQLPIIPGWDVSGTIKKVGSNVTNLKPGDQVYTYAKKSVIQWGTYAEYVCFSAKDTAKKPQNLSLAEAAAIPLSALTAWQALFENGTFFEGQTILINGGSGGVGSFAIQMAKNAKAKRIYATASKEKADYVKSLGVDFPIDYKSQSFVEIIRRMEPNGLDFIFDAVGGRAYFDALHLLKHGGGQIISILEPSHPDISEKNHIKTGYVFVRPSGHDLNEISQLIEEGKVKAPKIEILPLNQAATAQDLVQSGKVFGKIVLQVSDS